ncbi:hypothetical protein ACFQ51_55815 [Streptomyces kaempferi]
MNNLQTAFWVAGKSLETMKTGNLHRNEGVPNFGDYVMDTWEVSESQAHRLMDAWRIGEALAAMSWMPREAQIRELTDVRNESGDQAAVAVYDTVARSVRRVTAKLLSEVVRELPPLPRQASPRTSGIWCKKSSRHGLPRRQPHRLPRPVFRRRTEGSRTSPRSARNPPVRTPQLGSRARSPVIPRGLVITEGTISGASQRHWTTFAGWSGGSASWP